MKGKFPDFIGLGVARCGTTWVHDMLMQHPEISWATANRTIPFCYGLAEAARLEKTSIFPVKEVNFWNHFAARQWNCETHFYDNFAQKSKLMESYKALFSNSTNGQKAGEITNNYSFYLLDPNIMKSFRDNMPEVKLFMIIRNPVERFISHYFFQWDNLEEVKRLGLISKENEPKFNSLKDDINNVITWLRKKGPKDVLKPIAIRWYVMGQYDVAIENILNHYPQKQLVTILLDDIKQRSHAVLRGLCKFLEIDPDFKFQDVEKSSNVLRKKKEVGPQHREKLRELYGPSVKRTGAMLRKNLDHWLR